MAPAPLSSVQRGLVDLVWQGLLDQVPRMLHWLREHVLVPAVLILLVLGLASLLKRAQARIVHEAERRYYLRKIINMTAGILCALIVILALVEDAKAIPTVLGFATAGLAIALQDVIVSIFGWMFLIGKRGIRVGDRIQIEEVKGDVVDLTIFRLTLIEVGNWVGGEQSTGRKVVFPNSFVFKKHFFNYTAGNQYLWDEIHVTITFESDWRKAKAGLLAIVEDEVREVVRAARAELERTPDTMLVRMGVLTPIVWVSIAAVGVDLALRYLTLARNRRTLGSRITERILDYINAAPDIDLAYDTRRQIQEVVQPARNHAREALSAQTPSLDQESR